MHILSFGFVHFLLLSVVSEALAVAMAMASLSLPPSISMLPPPQSPSLLRAGGALRLHSQISPAPAVPSLRFASGPRYPGLVLRASAMDVASSGDDEADNGEFSSTLVGNKIEDAICVSLRILTYVGV